MEPGIAAIRQHGGGKRHQIVIEAEGDRIRTWFDGMLVDDAGYSGAEEA